ncbi:uncharacterized protein LOC128993042 isoform X2 [Macrosteles quadrilineatus]|uniref:uncharacterized protein LOC128993042 isoform X2 n=1 Tax=Macrosteles quadrilineatus TaxID=74068 RepID=UPI0023E260F0|nr:uncharacterized protein LOC128993042 isoform X2 [Macrosteles quadrilineatus]
MTTKGKQATTRANAFTVEKILDSRDANGTTEYLLKWRGYSDDNNSWETEETVGKQLIQEFWKRKISFQSTVKKGPSNSNKSNCSLLKYLKERDNTLEYQPKKKIVEGSGFDPGGLELDDSIKAQILALSEAVSSDRNIPSDEDYVSLLESIEDDLSSGELTMSDLPGAIKSTARKSTAPIPHKSTVLDSRIAANEILTIEKSLIESAAQLEKQSNAATENTSDPYNFEEYEKTNSDSNIAKEQPYSSKEKKSNVSKNNSSSTPICKILSVSSIGKERRIVKENPNKEKRAIKKNPLRIPKSKYAEITMPFREKLYSSRPDFPPLPLEEGGSVIFEDIGVKVEHPKYSPPKNSQPSSSNRSITQTSLPPKEIEINDDDPLLIDIDELLLDKNTNEENCDIDIDVGDSTDERLDLVCNQIQVGGKTNNFTQSLLKKSNIMPEKRPIEIIDEGSNKKIRMAFKKNDQGVMGVKTISDKPRNNLNHLSPNKISLCPQSKKINPTATNNFLIPAPPGPSLLKRPAMKNNSLLKNNNANSALSLLKTSKPSTSKILSEPEKSRQLVQESRKKEILTRLSKNKNLNPFNLLDHMSEYEINILGGEVIKDDNRPQGFERNLEPERVIGATKSTGELMLHMKWKGSKDTDFVTAREAHLRCPELVIQYYQGTYTLQPEVEEPS